MRENTITADIANKLYSSVSPFVYSYTIDKRKREATESNGCTTDENKRKREGREDDNTDPFSRNKKVMRSPAK